MINKIIKLTKSFISIRSVQGDRKSLDKILNLALVQLNDFTVERFEHNGVKSALVYTTRKRPKKFKIIVNGHLDVIPAKKNQFTPKVVGDKLYGAGSMDMKASTACLIEVFKQVANKVDYPLGLQLVTDEEVGGFNATRYQIEKGVRADFVIAGEPTNFDIVNKAKGVLQVKISAKGRTAHGAYPWRGENAIWKMLEFLNILEKHYSISNREGWITTLNLSKIEATNRAFNKIPDDCMAWLDVRVIPRDEEAVLKKIKRIMPHGFLLEVVVQEPALHTDRRNEYVGKLKNVIQKTTGRKPTIRGANGTSDARHFARVNCPGVEFGPVGGDIGGDHEWVKISSLNKYCQILKSFLLSLKS